MADFDVKLVLKLKFEPDCYILDVLLNKKKITSTPSPVHDHNPNPCGTICIVLVWQA